MKKRNFTLWFLRRFPEFRITEEQRVRLFERANELMQEKTKLRKKVESDAALIESLNRYITALEGKADMQSEALRDLKRQLKELLAKPKTGGRKKA
ncbi:MAG: hypothetical protein LBV17_08640 [Treponema sp.]|jgi:predicted nuclease with TOPRIM domain|nr:hypothetical protein [Treponema sp.]